MLDALSLDLFRPDALRAVDALDLPARFSAGRSHLLANALSAAKANAPNHRRLADFILPRLPRMPLASSTLHTATPCSEETLLDGAVSMPWISFNNAEWTNAIGIDCDHGNADEKVDDFMRHLREVDPDAPEPLIVRDPWTFRAHVTWFLEKPVYTGQQQAWTATSSAPVLRTLAAVQRGLCKALGGDQGFTNRLTKNPFGVALCPAGQGSPPLTWYSYLESGTRLRFQTVRGDCRQIGLLTLWRALKLWREDTGEVLPGPRRRLRPDPADGQKGTRLFDASRFRVYDLGTSDLAEIAAVVDEEASRLGSPASPGQRGKVARSIARFMRTKWTGVRTGTAPGKRRGILALDAASLDLPERQALGARHAARVNAADTDRRIANAVAALRAAGSALTQNAIAVAAGVSVRTVRRRWHAPAHGLEPDKQCPSGNAPLGAPRAAGPSSRESSNHLLPSLSVTAGRDAGIRNAVAVLVEFTASLRCRGALPVDLPVLPAAISAQSEVRTAMRFAREALADARRRAAARVERQIAMTRSAEMRIRAQDPADGWRWFRNMLADLDAEWDAREAAVDHCELPYVRNKREAVIIGRWRSWRAALRHHRPEPSDEVIPW